MKTITGTFLKPDGSAIANGHLVLKLSQAATVTGTAQIAPVRLVFDLDASGTLGAGKQLYANDELSPLGTYYDMSVRDGNDVSVSSEARVSITGGTTIDLNTVLATSNGVMYPSLTANAVLLSTVSTQTLSGPLAVPSGVTAPLTGNVTGSVTGNVTSSGTSTFATLRVKDSPWIDIMHPSFGVVGDGVADDSAAIQAVLTAYPGKQIMFPKTQAIGSVDYYCASSLTMKGFYQIVEGFGRYVTIKFASGVPGFVLDNSLTSKPTIRRLYIQGSESYNSVTVGQFVLPGGTDTTGVSYGGTSLADGIRVAADHTCLEDLVVENFGRHGVYVFNNDAAISMTGKNADHWYIKNVNSRSNRGNGFMINGNDSNVGTGINMDASSNQLWGIEENNTLSNCFIMPHTNNNHTDNSGGAGAAVWAGVAGLTGGPFRSLSAGGNSTWVSPYSESGQPVSEMKQTAVVINGQNGGDFDYTKGGPYMMLAGTIYAPSALGLKIWNPVNATNMVTFKAGKTTAQTMTWRCTDNADVKMWDHIHTQNNYTIQDKNGKIRVQLDAGGVTDINGVTSQPISFNRSASSGTGGIQGYDGAASPAITWTINASGLGTFNGGVKAGASGTTITQTKVYTPTLTPASVAANTTAEQTFTVTGLTTADSVYICGPALTAGTGIVNVRVSAADTVAVMFSNNTAGALTPTSGTYRIVALRS